MRSGDDYVAGDVECQPLLGNAQVATYCASVREGGKANGKPTGVLAIHFDWEPQARAIVQGVRCRRRRQGPRAAGRFAAPRDRGFDGKGMLTERVSIFRLRPQRCGFYQDRSGALVAFHATPGYETYKGLGWYGVILASGGGTGLAAPKAVAGMPLTRQRSPA